MAELKQSRHQIIARRNPQYPFNSYWVCTCGHMCEATYMGVGKGGVEEEFARHVEESSDLEEGSD